MSKILHHLTEQQPLPEPLQIILEEEGVYLTEQQPLPEPLQIILEEEGVEVIINTL
jgi:hypothetical protein